MFLTKPGGITKTRWGSSQPRDALKLTLGKSKAQVFCSKSNPFEMWGSPFIVVGAGGGKGPLPSRRPVRPALKFRSDRWHRSDRWPAPVGPPVELDQNLAKDQKGGSLDKSAKCRSDRSRHRSDRGRRSDRCGGRSDRSGRLDR